VTEANVTGVAGRPLGAALTVVLIVTGAVTIGVIALVTSLVLRACSRFGLSTGTASHV